MQKKAPGTAHVRTSLQTSDGSQNLLGLMTNAMRDAKVLALGLQKFVCDFERVDHAVMRGTFGQKTFQKERCQKHWLFGGNACGASSKRSGDRSDHGSVKPA